MEYHSLHNFVIQTLYLYPVSYRFPVLSVCVRLCVSMSESDREYRAKIIS